MRQVSRDEIIANVLETLNLDAETYSIDSIEMISGLLRRSAGFLCPCTEKTLIGNVENSLYGLSNDIETTRKLVKETLDLLISHGDLLEHQEVVKERGLSAILIYAAPPAYVRIRDGSVFLLGILPDRITLLPEELERKIVYKKHLRRLSNEDSPNLLSELNHLGLFEIPINTWLKAPKIQKAASLINYADKMLDMASPSGEIPGLMVIDSSKPVQYFKGRWNSPNNLSGRYIARRKQLYGADIWCYVELETGIPQKFIDFPTRGSIWRGCDEAWLLQAAIDYSFDHPQTYEFRPGKSESTIIDFYSPVPAWLGRQLDAVGEKVESHNCLFSYEFGNSDLNEIEKFITKRFWLKKNKSSQL